MAVKFSDFTPGATIATTELVGYVTGSTTNNRYSMDQVAVGIFAADSGLTAGSVLFTGADGVTTQDNANFFWDDTNNNLKVIKRKFTITSNVDGNVDGDVVYFGGTTSMTIGTIYHYKSDGTWEVADPNAVANSDGLLAVALGAASDTNGMLLRGMVTLDHDPGAVGDVLYLSAASIGDATATAPAGTGDIVRIIGYCLDASDGQIWFNPDSTFVELS